MQNADTLVFFVTLVHSCRKEWQCPPWVKFQSAEWGRIHTAPTHWRSRWINLSSDCSTWPAAAVKISHCTGLKGTPTHPTCDLGMQRHGRPAIQHNCGRARITMPDLSRPKRYRSAYPDDRSISTAGRRLLSYIAENAVQNIFCAPHKTVIDCVPW